MKLPWSKSVKTTKPVLSQQYSSSPQSEMDHAQQATSFLMQPFWAEMLLKMQEMRAGALGNMRKRQLTDFEELQVLEHWRTVEEITLQLERYPESIVESFKEREWQSKQQQ